MCGVFTGNRLRAVTMENREAWYLPVGIVQLSCGSTSSMATTIPDTQDCESQGLAIFPDSGVGDPAPWFVF
jgi:hypothetical protein